MVTTSSLTHVPTTKTLILLFTLSSTIVSITDSKHLLPIKPTPHLWPYLQFTRLLTYQLAFTSATEVLVAVSLVYQFRVLERVWGGRKYASFILVVFGVNCVVVPVVCLFVKLFSLGWWNYVPAGGVGVAFAGLAAWRGEVPRLYRWKVLTGDLTGPRGSSRENNGESSSERRDGTADQPGIILSDKSTTYLLAAQLALSQFPFQLMPAAVGWIVGTAWVEDLLPGRMGRWRVPAWVVGEIAKGKERGQYEGLRRRLEEEGSAADGMRNVTDRASRERGDADGRRGFLGQIRSYFTGS